MEKEKNLKGALNSIMKNKKEMLRKAAAFRHIRRL